MVIICEQCQTRFKLDESRIPAGGARVRCSRCKHAFFLPAPGSDGPDLLDELISQAAADAQRAPPATEDLDESHPTPEPVFEAPSQRDPPPEPASRGVPSGGEARESDWEFSDDVPAGDAGEDPTGPGWGGLRSEEGVGTEGSGLELASEVPASPEAPWPAVQTPARVVGPPEPPVSAIEPAAGDELDWDLTRDLSPDVNGPGLLDASPEEAFTRAAPESGGPITRPRSPEFLEAPERAGRLLGAAGWLATVVLAGLVTVQLLAPPPAAIREPISARPVGPLVAESLRGRFVDNLFVGPLLVVTTELRNPGKSPTSLGATLRAVLVDPGGRPVPGSRAALAPAAERELREHPPESLAVRLAERAQSLASLVIAPGASVTVTGVFPASPPEARGLSLELGPPPSEEPSP